MDPLYELIDKVGLGPLTAMVAGGISIGVGFFNLLFGIFHLFWGYRFYRQIAVIQGFLWGALLTGVLAIATEAPPGVAIMAAMGGGTILALLAVPLYHVFLFIGNVLMGLVTGLMIGVLATAVAIFAGVSDSVAADIGGTIGLSLALILAIVGGVTVFLWRKHVIICLTAWMGAACILEGLVQIIEGIAPGLLGRLGIAASGSYQLILIGLGVFALGVFVQLKHTGERQPRWEEVDPEQEIPQIHPAAAARLAEESQEPA